MYKRKLPEIGKYLVDLRFSDKYLNKTEFYVVNGKQGAMIGFIKLWVLIMHKNVNLKTINLIKQKKMNAMN